MSVYLSYVTRRPAMARAGQARPNVDRHGHAITSQEELCVDFKFACTNHLHVAHVIQVNRHCCELKYLAVGEQMKP